jgi:hypothetical protein
MAAVYTWLRQMWSSLVTEAELSEQTSATDEPGFTDPCHLFLDGLEEELEVMDRNNKRIGELLDQYWNCRDQQQTAAFEASQNVRKSLEGAKLLLNTAGNRVRQVISEIEIVTQTQQQATTE